MRKDIRSLLYISCFIDIFGASFIVPILQAYLLSLGFTHSVTGIISSAYAGIQLLSGPIIGSWSDTYGRKTVLYFTLFVCSACYCLLGFAKSFVVILCIRSILGLMKHTQTICKSVVADVIPLNKQGETQGKLIAVAGLGFMIGPAIGGNIAELENGFQYICCITSVLFLLNSLIVYFLFPNIKIQSNNNKINKQVTLASSIFSITTDLSEVNWSCFWDVFLLRFILAVSITTFFSTYYNYVGKQFNITPKYVGYTISFQGLVSAVSSMQVNIFNSFYNSDSNSKKSTWDVYFLKLNHCFIMLSLSFLFLYLSSNIYLFLFCLFPLCCSTSLIRTITTDLVLERSDPRHRGSLMGTTNSVSSTARMIAPLLTGIIQDLFNISYVLLFVFVISAFGTIISMLLKNNYFSKSKTKIK